MLGFSSLVPYQHPPPALPPCCAFLYHDGTRKQGRELHLVSNEMKQKKAKTLANCIKQSTQPISQGEKKEQRERTQVQAKRASPKMGQKGQMKNKSRCRVPTSH